MPGSDLMRKAASYVEPVLHPFRQLLYRYFPRLPDTSRGPVPLAVWLVIDGSRCFEHAEARGDLMRGEEDAALLARRLTSWRACRG